MYVRILIGRDANIAVRSTFGVLFGSAAGAETRRPQSALQRRRAQVPGRGKAQS
jgi:hypothetical protein